ncbi:MAG: YgfZ/GcvT domain-containing protein, partial [Chthoniobacterales bacterium]
LERYVIADDVVIKDVTEQFALFHVLGRGAVDGVQADRYGIAAVDLWVGASEHDALAQRLRSIAPFCDDECEDVFRIERGVPRWGRELTEEIIPTEANLESSAIDYAKGCYIGQEVISRIKISGQTNKRLCGLITTSANPLQNGTRLWTTDADAKDVGWITSAAMSRRFGSQIALGFVKRGFQEIDTQLAARAVDATSVIPVQITALPFV